MVDALENDFKTATTSMFKGLKKDTCKNSLMNTEYTNKQLNERKKENNSRHENIIW